MYKSNYKRRHKSKSRTLKSVFDEWFEQVLCPSLALSTVKRYEQELRLRLFRAPMMPRQIDEIKAIQITGFYNTLHLEGSSINSIRIIHNLLSGFFSYCIKAEILTKNPMNAVQFPKFKNTVTTPPKKSCLTGQEVQKIVKHAESCQETFIFVFAIFTGLRQGEILALTYNDIKDWQISVNKTMYALTHEGRKQIICTSAKTHKSVRDVPFLKNLMSMYEAHVALEKEKHRECGIDFSKNSIVFSSSTCGYSCGRNLRRKLSKLLNYLEIEPTNFHGLRHTFCTNLAKNGVGLKTASLLMGHANPNITMNVYTHVQEDEMTQGIASLSNLFVT